LTNHYYCRSDELVLGIPTRQLELLFEGKLDLAFIDNGDVHAVNFQRLFRI
jgi:hypothetical protein